MKGWRVLKITLIGILVIANVFMLGFLYSVFRPMERIPEDAIRQMRELFRRDGIYIPQGVVDDRKINPVIYEGDMGNDYYIRVAEELSGSDVSRTFDAPNGMVVSLKSGDRCTFYDGFGLRYMASDAPEHYTVTTLDVDSLTAVEPSLADSMKKSVAAFVSPALPTGERGGEQAESYSVIACGKDSKTDIGYVICQQWMEGYPLADFRTVFAVYGGEIIGMSGSWCFASRGATYSAQLMDQINILYSVRARILEERGDSGSDRVEITSMELGYAVYFRDDTENFYLIPAWNVGTDSGEIYCINAVDGTLYTK